MTDMAEGTGVNAHCRGATEADKFRCLLGAPRPIGTISKGEPKQTVSRLHAIEHRPTLAREALAADTVVPFVQQPFPKYGLLWHIHL